jgi:hypothetical protein
MSTSTARQTFRALVADVAARAKAKLPECNGRVESATALVLAGDVFVSDDGSVEVGSCTDPRTMHRLAGRACTCEDSQYGRAPGSWCKHRLAHAIYTRAHQEMAARAPDVEPEVELPADFETWGDNDSEAPLPEEVEAPSPLPCPAPLPEARSSANVRLQVCGHEVQITLRDHDEAALMVRLTALIHGYGPPPPPPPPPVEPTPQCPQHGALKKSTKGQGWYCPHKVTDDTWCPSKGK